MDIDVLKQLNFMEDLPNLYDLAICRNISAHDKKGGNDNGFTNKAEFIRLEGKRTTVIIDAVGPACIYYTAAFWMNHPIMHPKFVERWELKRLGNVNFRFDGESDPSIKTRLNKFVGEPPRVYPMAQTPDESTGAMVCYAPMPFGTHSKVTVDGGKTPAFGLHFWYHCYPPGTKVPAFSEMGDVLAAGADFQPESAWKPAAANLKETDNLVVPPGGTREIFNSSSGGAIKCIRMKVPEKDSLLRNLRLKAWWDDEKEPSIDAPVSLLFAIENYFPDYPDRRRWIDKRADMKGAIVGRDPDGLFFLRLPMPFASAARIEIENVDKSEAAFPKIRIEYDDGAAPGLGKSAGYLRAEFRESHDLTPGHDYVFLHAKGRGKVVGTVLAVENTHECFLEGDEHVYVDGSRSPAIIGDATETYYNGSWYFCEKAVALPVHGTPTFRMKTFMGGDISDITMYRFHPSDFVPFRSEVRFSIQHGGFNEVPGNYRSLAFYYHLPEPGLAETDYVNMSDGVDLTAHGFSGEEPKSIESRSGFFEGDFNGQDIGTLKRPWWIPPIWWMIYWTLWGGNRRKPPENSPDRVTFSVAKHGGPHEFKMKIDPKAKAVILRRVLDQSVFDQRAKIEVDGAHAAEWFNTGNNKWKIFAEDDIFLDPETTRGKSEITVRIVPVSTLWTAAEYTAMSVTIPGAD